MGRKIYVFCCLSNNRYYFSNPTNSKKTMTIFNYISDNLIDIISVLTAIVTAASAIAALTPTPADDSFIGKYIYPVVNWLALNVGKAKK